MKKYNRQERTKVITRLREMKRSGMSTQEMADVLNQESLLRPSGQVWAAGDVSGFIGYHKISHRRPYGPRKTIDVVLQPTFETGRSSEKITDKVELATLVVAANIDAEKKEQLLKAIFN